MVGGRGLAELVLRPGEVIQRYAGVLEGKSATFLKLYEMIENHVRRLFRVYKFIRVDLVMDFYYSLSLKSSTRENRGLGKVANLSSQTYFQLIYKKTSLEMIIIKNS